METSDFKSIVGCFWQNENGKWEGVLKQDLEQVDLKVLKRSGVILLLEMEPASG